MTASQGKKRALIVRGGWEGHDPVAATDRFLPFLHDRGYRVRTAESLDVYEDTSELAATDLIVQCWTMGEVTPAQAAGLSGAVHAGTGLAGWHGGICDSFRDNADYQLLTGGQFVMHPEGFHDHTLDVTALSHPVTSGLPARITVHTEQYYVHIDPAATVLATTTFADRPGLPAGITGVTSPAVWTRTWGLGRVFVSTTGHKVEDFDTPELRTLTERGLLWASR